jgi:5-methylcytosine-specific restriction protein A
MSVWPYTTRQWGRVRLQKLAESPLCEVCLRQFAEVVPAEVVDHRVPISEYGRKVRSAAEAFPHLSGLASLCIPHHNQKTRAEQLGEKNWMRKGCDVFGYPLDPDHPWNKERARMKGSSR